MTTKPSHVAPNVVTTSTPLKDDLLNTTMLKKMIECAIISPHVRNEKPISLLIVAKAESGKTSVMRQYRNNKGIVYMTDCTAYGIQHEMLQQMIDGQVNSLIIADILTPLSKSTKTRLAFVAFLNNLIEEGVARISTYVTSWEKPVRCNVITAVTDEAIEDGRHEWGKIGFLSRFIIFSYSYPLATVMQILASYSKRGLPNSTTILKLPKKTIEVHLPENIAAKLDPIAIKVGEQFNLYGLRAKVNFRCLLKCLAHRNGRKVVEESDFTEFLELAEYMNFKYNPLR